MRLLKVIILLMLILYSNPVFSQSPGTKARIEEKGNIWVLDKGSVDGVSLDLEGYLMKKAYSPKARKFILEKVAHLKVSKVFQYFCYAKVDKWTSGFSAKDAQWAQFIKRLSPTRARKQTTGPVKAQEIAAGKTQRWYFDKGDNAFNLQKYGLALDYYEKVLEKYPDDPGAKIRIRKAKGKHFLQQGDLDYKNQEYSSAYEYYLMAFQLREADDIAAAEKILGLWKKNRELYDKTKEFEISPDVILEPLINHCDKLLEENRLDKLVTLAQKIKGFAENDQLKSKLDTLTAAKEIQNDMDNANFKKILTSIDTSIDQDNLYKAGYIIKKMDSLAVDDETKTRLTALKEKLRSKKTQVRIRQAIELKKEKIKKLAEEARAFIAIKNYDDAIARYLEIYKLEPGKKEHSDKIAELQTEKFKLEKSQREIKAKVERDSLILHAEDYFQRDLMQDSLDYYIRAYKIFPEEGKAVAGVGKVLEICSKDDAKFLSTTLLGRKLTKFTKDFLSHIEKTYLNSRDEKGFEILAKIIFITNNKSYGDLTVKFKSNLYGKSLKLGHQQFKAAAFDNAAALYQKARDFKNTAEINIRLKACSRLKDIKRLLEEDSKKVLNPIFNSMMTNPNKYDILEGMLNLSEKYLENSDFKKAKYLYHKVEDFQVFKFKDRVTALKNKEKGLKKKAKEAKKKKK